MRGKVETIHSVECVVCGRKETSWVTIASTGERAYMTKKAFIEYLARLGSFHKMTGLWVCGSPCSFDYAFTVEVEIGRTR